MQLLTRPLSAAQGPESKPELGRRAVNVLHGQLTPQEQHMFTQNVILLKWARLLAVVSVALYLIPAGAHLFELANKMYLPPAEYMIVQRIYAGWSLFGVAIVAALFLTSIHTFIVRADRTAFLLSLTSVLCLVATQMIFWAFTYPMNVASNNWTVTPENFEVARRQWEYSHAVNAVITFIAFVAIISSVLVDKREMASMSAVE